MKQTIFVSSTYDKILRFLAIFFTFTFLTTWGALNRIHSSEFWPIYFSKYTFKVDEIQTILFKPLFNLFLYLFHWFPLSDVQHILLIKIIFSFLGTLQIYLFYQICNHLLKHTKQGPYLSLLLAGLLITEPFYLENFFRIRSDQLSTTVFLFVLYSQLRNPLSLTQKAFYIILNCSIAIKSFFFGLLLATFQSISPKFERKQKIYISLAALAAVVWMMNIFWKAILYYIQTLDSYVINLVHLKKWLMSDFLIIALIIVQLFLIIYRRQKEYYQWIYYASVLFLTLVLISQKYTFFLASLIPLIYVLIAATLASSNDSIRLYLFVGLFTLGMHGFRLTQEFAINTNYQQLKFIYLFEPFIKEKKYSYIDSIGLFPNQNNLNCFVSPDDHDSKEYCKNLIINQKVDIIIYTQRLMGIIQPSEILESGYDDIGYNIYAKSSLVFKPLKFENTYPALINFGFEK